MQTRIRAVRSPLEIESVQFARYRLDRTRLLPIDPSSGKKFRRMPGPIHAR
jgi:hypothetical protein